MNNSKKILIFFIFVGFLLRLKAALSLDVLADDMLYASQSAGILDAKILSTHSNPPLFFYLTDISYKIFGHTTFASRFWPLIAGTLLIVLIFMITKLLCKDEKIALIAAGFVTFSTFLIRMTFTEQSLLLLFFVGVGVIYSLKYMDSPKRFFLITASVSFGLALLTKYNAPFFILPTILFLGLEYERRNNQYINKIIKHSLIFCSILILIALPFLAFNYFIYKDKGIVDVYFSRIIHLDKTQALYGGLAGQEESFFNRLKTPSSYGQYILSLKTDILLSIFSIIGLGLMFSRKQKEMLIFTLLFVAIPFILQSGGSALAKHFIFIPFFLSIPAALGLNATLDKFVNAKYLKFAYISIALLMLLNLGASYGTPDNFFSTSATSELKDFINEKVSSSDIIVLDSRIYAARNFWLATPHAFLLSEQFPQVFEASKNLSSVNLQPTKVFVVECVIEDCGWGWVQNNERFNKTNEEVINVLAENGLLLKTISARTHTTQEIFSPGDETEIYKVHFLSLNLPKNLNEIAKNAQTFYFTPYLYINRENYIFGYSVDGIGKLINSLCLWIIYLAVILSPIITIIICLETSRQS